MGSDCKYLVGINEISKALRITPAKLQEWIEEGMPYIKVGNTHRANLDEIWEWMKEYKDERKKKLKKNDNK